MAPDLILQILLCLFGVVTGLAITQYYRALYHQCVWSGFFSVVLLALLVALYVRNGLIKREKLEEDKQIVSSLEVKNVLNDLPKQESIQKDPGKDPLAGSKIKKLRMGGLILEGQRTNLIPADWFDSQSISVSGSKKRISRVVAPGIDEPEYLFTIKAGKVLTLTIAADVDVHRRDYTFSFLCYTQDNDFSSIDLELSLGGDSERVQSQFSFDEENIITYIQDQKLAVHRPEVSLLFSTLPKSIEATVSIANQSNKDFEFIISFPVIEQGLFASMPIACGQKRSSEFVYWKRADIFRSDEGTLSFFFQPYWGVRELTPGISPHLFDCTTDDSTNGIRIYSDSHDDGKIKVEIADNSDKRYISSDVVPLKGQVYSIAFRWRDGLTDLVVNGRNISTAKDVWVPDHENLPEFFFLGSSPKSEGLSAFGVFRDLKVYSRWLSDRIIRADIDESMPTIFPEFEDDARVMSGIHDSMMK